LGEILNQHKTRAGSRSDQPKERNSQHRDNAVRKKREKNILRIWKRLCKSQKNHSVKKKKVKEKREKERNAN
jgi:hypothetical protein